MYITGRLRLSNTCGLIDYVLLYILEIIYSTYTDRIRGGIKALDKKGRGVMMNQLYSEACVKRKDTATTTGLRLLMFIGVFIGLFLLVMGQLWSYVGVALIVVVFFLYPRLSVEYEYVYVDGQLDFDRITGKAKRKTMLRIDFEQVEIMAPYDSPALDSYNHIQMEKRDFSSLSKDSKPYAIISSSGSKKLKILFEPSEKMLNMIKQKNPRKIIL